MSRFIAPSKQKRGGILTLTLLSCSLLIFLAVTVFGYDRMQIWLARNQHDETFALYNAQSAWEWAMMTVRQNCQAKGWSGAASIVTEFSLNEGSCQAELNYNPGSRELVIDTIGQYRQTYYRLHGVLLLAATEVKRPVAWVTDPVTGSGSFFASDTALQEGVILTTDTATIEVNLAAAYPPLFHRVQRKTEIEPSEVLFQPILAAAGISGMAEALAEENQLLTYFVPTQNGLQAKQLLYIANEQEFHLEQPSDTLLAADNLLLDLTAAGAEINLPSLYCLRSLTILARPEQIIHCTGFLYADQLILQQANLSAAPDANVLAELLYWFNLSGIKTDQVLFWQNIVYCTEYRHIFSALAAESR
ncbi:MAG: hypothetical protein LLG09_05025 [Negativicutes bacterium]|nr:hypothetical protein [Negativicutes bacterium]